jgi:hypothetical protein
MEITNYDPPITLWAFNVSEATVFPITVIAESDYHLHQPYQGCLPKASLPTFTTFCEARHELIGQLSRLLSKAAELEAGDAVQ